MDSVIVTAVAVGAMLVAGAFYKKSKNKKSEKEKD